MTSNLLNELEESVKVVRPEDRNPFFLSIHEISRLEHALEHTGADHVVAERLVPFSAFVGDLVIETLVGVHFRVGTFAFNRHQTTVGKTESDVGLGSVKGCF